MFCYASFSSLVKCGILDVWNLLVRPLGSKYLVLLLVPIDCFFGNQSLNLGFFKHFLANFKHNLSLLFAKVSSPSLSIISLYEDRLSPVIILTQLTCTDSISCLFLCVSPPDHSGTAISSTDAIFFLYASMSHSVGAPRSLRKLKMRILCHLRRVHPVQEMEGKHLLLLVIEIKFISHF